MNCIKPKVLLKRSLLFLLILLAILFGIVLPVISVSVYRHFLNVCFITEPHHMCSVDDFEGLSVEDVTFPAKQGHLLAGFKYSMEHPDPPRGVVVFAHGLFSGGQNRYMPILAYFAAQGFEVFAYDATGNDASGGLVGGVPRGVMDLDYAIRYVKQDADYAGLPICLFGYSWGAYSVANVLNFHQDIKAIAVFAGFDKPSELVHHMGYQEAGNWINLALPYVSIYERLLFGEYAAATALDGFAAAEKTEVMIVHSTDDPVVPFRYGYERFHAAHGDDPRFRFVRFEDRGHDYLMFSEDAIRYQHEAYSEYDAYLAEHGLANNSESRAAYRHEFIDDDLFFALNDTVMSEVVSMFCAE